MLNRLNLLEMDFCGKLMINNLIGLKIDKIFLDLIEIKMALSTYDTFYLGFYQFIPGQQLILLQN